MATLDMVPLRSKMPPTGRVTLRYALPTVKIDVPEDVRAARLPRIATTPQVEADADGTADADLETPARKGGEAR
jgi:hypothetical protein